MGQQLCTPSNIYGPLQQHIFLGASVSNFSCSLGWGAQASEVTITLVNDPCTSSTGKVYYDQNCIRQITTAADPGFIGESYQIIGAPAMFRFGDGTNDFEFTGLIQSWEKISSTAGNPTYIVRLVSPVAILEGTQCIITDYAGPVQGYNIFNLYGYMEYAQGLTCPLNQVFGAYFGSPAGGFGGAKVNENGMPFQQIGLGLSLLTSSFPRAINDWSPYGRILFKGAPVKGYGLLPSDTFTPSVIPAFPNHTGWLCEYLLDISDIPAPPAHWRLSGPVSSVFDIISQVCDQLGSDFYIELVPVRFGGRILKIIKVRSVRRLVQPNSTAITSFIASNPNVIAKRAGQELRNEVTSAFLMGGNVHSIYEAYQNLDPENDGAPANAEVDDMIVPFFGFRKDGSMIVPELGINGWEFEIETDMVNSILNNALGVSSVIITERELRTVHANDGFNSWHTYALDTPTEIGQALLDVYGVSLVGIMSAVDAAKFIQDNFKLGADQALIYSKQVYKDLEILYKWISEFANKLGGEWAIRLPYTCTRIDDESLTDQFTEQPTSEGGWSENDTILGLPHPDITNFFATPDGRIECFVSFPAEEVNLDQINEDDYIIYDDEFYARGTVEETIVFHDYPNRSIPRVIVHTNVFRLKPDLADTADAFKAAIDAANVQAGLTKLGGILGKFGLAGQYVEPLAFAIPMRSNVLRYGPWMQAGPAGQIKVELDQDLVPWSFGSIENMNIAANARSQESLTQMQWGEMGDITVPGWPTIPLGAELGAVGAGFLNSFLLIENRIVNTNQFNANSQNNIWLTLPALGWNGVYGPNITKIDVQVGDQITTTYQLRTFTPQIGKLARKNYEKLRLLGQQNVQIQSIINRRNFINQNIQEGLNNSSRLRQELNIEAGGGAPLKGKTPHGMLAAQMIWESGRNYTSVLSYDYKEILSELEEDYNKKAFMSMDGIFRPVSIQGEGNLPRFISAIASSNSYNYPEAPEPPIEGYTPAEISIDYLNPLTNPNDDFHGSQNGHDISWVGRGASLPKSLNIYVDQNEGGGYTDDYRFLALKGPLVLTQPGYDLQGKPVPNKADQDFDNLVAASGGNFRTTGLKDEFPDNVLKKPYSWPVAPIDLRLDRKRGVWTVPSPFRIVTATLNSNLIANGAAPATIQGGPTIYKADGTTATKNIIVHDEIGNRANGSTKVLAYYDTYDEEYKVIECLSQSGVGGSGVFIRKTPCEGDIRDIGQAGVLNFGNGFIVGELTGASGEIRIDSVVGILHDPELIGNLTDTEIRDKINGIRVNSIKYGRGLSAEVDNENLEDISGCSGILLYPSLVIGKQTCYPTTDITYSDPGITHILYKDGFKVENNMPVGAADEYKVSITSKLAIATDDTFADNLPILGTYINGLKFGRGLSAVSTSLDALTSDYGCDALLVSLNFAVRHDQFQVADPQNGCDQVDAINFDELYFDVKCRNGIAHVAWSGFPITNLDCAGNPTQDDDWDPSLDIYTLPCDELTFSKGLTVKKDQDKGSGGSWIVQSNFQVSKYNCYTDNIIDASDPGVNSLVFRDGFKIGQRDEEGCEYTIDSYLEVQQTNQEADGNLSDKLVNTIVAGKGLKIGNISLAQFGDPQMGCKGANISVDFEKVKDEVLSSGNSQAVTGSFFYLTSVTCVSGQIIGTGKTANFYRGLYMGST